MDMKNLMGMKMKKTKAFGSQTKTPFDDCSGNNDNNPAKGIKAIYIRSGYILDAIGVIDVDGGKTIHGNAAGGMEEIITLENDKVKCICGDMGVYYEGAAISNITVETQGGTTYGPFGTGKGGESFKLEVPDGSEVMGFYGTADSKKVESLGLVLLECDMGKLGNGFGQGGLDELKQKILGL